jgi:glycosyltransferase involved in cell wall biosynthesis
MYEAMDEGVFERTLEDVWPAVSRWAFVAEKNLMPFRERGLDVSRRFRRIPNGVASADTKMAGVIRSELDIPTDAFVLFVASRAIPEKGWREAIKVVTDARRRSGRDIRLVLGGDGPVHEELSKRPLPPFVYLLGFVASPVDYFGMADAGLLLSTFAGESQPLCVLECLAAGRPVIATAVGEVREMLSNERGEVAGHLIEIPNGQIPIGQTAQVVADLAVEAQRYAAKLAVVKDIAGRFDFERTVDCYVDLYEEAMGWAPVRTPSVGKCPQPSQARP